MSTVTARSLSPLGEGEGRASHGRFVQPARAPHPGPLRRSEREAESTSSNVRHETTGGALALTDVRYRGATLAPTFSPAPGEAAMAPRVHAQRANVKAAVALGPALHSGQGWIGAIEDGAGLRTPHSAPRWRRQGPAGSRSRESSRRPAPGGRETRSRTRKPKKEDAMAQASPLRYEVVEGWEQLPERLRARRRRRRGRRLGGPRLCVQPRRAPRDRLRPRRPLPPRLGRGRLHSGPTASRSSPTTSSTGRRQRPHGAQVQPGASCC